MLQLLVKCQLLGGTSTSVGWAVGAGVANTLVESKAGGPAGGEACGSPSVEEGRMASMYTSCLHSFINEPSQG